MSKKTIILAVAVIAIGIANLSCGNEPNAKGKLNAHISETDGRVIDLPEGRKLVSATKDHQGTLMIIHRDFRKEEFPEEYMVNTMISLGTNATVATIREHAKAEESNGNDR